MTKEQLTDRKAVSQIQHDAALQIREILDAAAAQIAELDNDGSDVEETILELVTG